MSNEKEFGNEVLKKIEELVEKNTNPNKIKTTLSLDSAYQTINGKIEKHFKKKWNTKDKKYASLPDDDVSASEENNDQIPKDGIQDMFDQVAALDEDEPNNKSRKKTSNRNHIDIDCLKSIDKKLSFLSTRIIKLENHIKENSPKEKKAHIESLINFYASTKDRDSVSINSEIKRKILEVIAKNYDITKNQSHAINTALLIAYYHEHGKKKNK